MQMPCATSLNATIVHSNENCDESKNFLKFKSKLFVDDEK